MERVVRAFPVLQGMEQAARELAQEMAGERQRESERFFRQFGVTHESWHLQETPAGTWIIAITEISEVPVAAVAESYAHSEEVFDVWFKERVLKITGIDPSTTPLGPPTERIFCFDAGG